MYSWQLYMLSVRFYLQPRGDWRQKIARENWTSLCWTSLQADLAGKAPECVIGQEIIRP